MDRLKVDENSANRVGFVKVRWNIFTMVNCISAVSFGLYSTSILMLIYRPPTNTRHNGTWIYCPQFITMKREILLEELRGLALRKNGIGNFNGNTEFAGLHKNREPILGQLWEDNSDGKKFSRENR